MIRSFSWVDIRQEFEGAVCGKGAEEWIQDSLSKYMFMFQMSGFMMYYCPGEVLFIACLRYLIDQILLKTQGMYGCHRCARVCKDANCLPMRYLHFL